MKFKYIAPRKVHRSGICVPTTIGLFTIFNITTVYARRHRDEHPPNKLKYVHLYNNNNNILTTLINRTEITHHNASIRHRPYTDARRINCNYNFKV